MKFGWPGILAVLAVFLLIPLNVEVVSAQTTTVAVSPSMKFVENGQGFSVEIVVTPGTSIAGAQFDMSFDPSLLRVESVEEGNLFTQGGASTYFQRGTINNTAGTVTGVASVILGPNKVTSPGTLAIVHFTAKNAQGTSSLTLSNVIVGDENGVAVPTSVTGGSVQVTLSGENSGDTNGDENQGGDGRELIYDDFNDGELGTNLGGLAGPMSPAPSYDPVVDFTSAAAEGAYALSLTYNLPPGQWCGYWSFANDADPNDVVNETIDVSSYTTLKFYLKGASGGEKFKIEITDSIFDPSSQESYLATQNHKAQVYVQATASWQEVEIPLTDFTVHTDLDLSDLRQINIVFDKTPRSGTVYIDKIRFTGRASGGEENNQNILPVAYIDFIEHPPTVYEDTRVVFSGHGLDPDGTITGYLWTSSIDGPLSTLSTFDTVEENILLSPGIHQIRFKVRDNSGAWSDEATAQLVVTSLVAGGSISGSEQASEASSEGSNEDLVILLGLEAAAAAALISFIVVKKFGYLKPAMDYICATEKLTEVPKPSMQISETVGCIGSTRPDGQSLPKIKEPAPGEPVSPRISLHDLSREVYSSKVPRYGSKEHVPEIPKEKWTELRARLRRLMNSSKKLM